MNDKFLKNRAECMTRVHRYLNETVPELKAELAKGFKVNATGELCKKDKERIQAIIDKRPHSRAVLHISEYSITLWADDNYVNSEPYPGGGYGCAYYSKTIYLWDRKKGEAYPEYNLREITEPELIQALEELKELEQAERAIEEQIYKRRRLFE